MKKILQIWKKGKRERRCRELNERAAKVINVAEFNGELYVAFNGVPVIKWSDTKGEITDVLDHARSAYKTYKYSNNEG